VGFCLGGLLAYLCATRLEIDVAVSFDGANVSDYLDELDQLKVPITFHYGDVDPHLPREGLSELESHPKIEVFIYPGVDHAFYNHARPQYREAAAKLAHTRTVEALKRVIGPSLH